MSDLPAKVAVLEQIAKGTEATLKEIKDDLRAMRTEVIGRVDRVDERQRTDFRILASLILTTTVALAGLIARARGWL